MLSLLTLNKEVADASMLVCSDLGELVAVVHLFSKISLNCNGVSNPSTSTHKKQKNQRPPPHYNEQKLDHPAHLVN